MTTQEIKALVAAKIAGQGNQVDLGNALSGIINSLCDALDAKPGILIVKGTVTSPEDGTFEPNAGQPSLQEVVSFFTTGGIVYLEGSGYFDIVTNTSEFGLQTHGLLWEE